MKVDIVALKEQAAVVGKVAEESGRRRDEKAALEGVWNLLHALLDDLETTGQVSLEVSE